MQTIYTSKKTSIILTTDKNIIKTIIRPLNEKEHEIQTLAHQLGVAPKVINYSFDNTDKKLIIEMEYINGMMLDNYLKQPNINKKKVKHALFIALNKLYNNGIDHKDLCSENIIVLIENGKLIIKILDYGDAKLYPDSIPLRLRDFSSFNNRNW